jgi:hypothetical protein
MSRFKFTTTDKGKCDVTVTLFTKDFDRVAQRTITFDIKPTIKELKDRYKEFKQEGAKFIRITSTPSCCSKVYDL